MSAPIAETYDISLKDVANALSRELLFKPFKHETIGWTRPDAARMWTSLYAGHSFGTILTRHEPVGSVVVALASGDRYTDGVPVKVTKITGPLVGIHDGVQRCSALAMGAHGLWCRGPQWNNVRYLVGFDPLECTFQALTSANREGGEYIDLREMFSRKYTLDDVVSGFVRCRETYLKPTFSPLEMQQVETNVDRLGSLVRDRTVSVCQLGVDSSADDLARARALNGHN